MRTLNARPAMAIRFLVIASIAFGASCASTGFRDDGDDRPPVVVSNGSVVFDPTDGTFERDGSNRKWKNKGIPGRNARTVRFEIVVSDGTCSTTGRFSGTKMDLYVSSSTGNGRVLVDIKSGNLRIEFYRDMRMQGKHVQLDDWTTTSLVVTEGANLGTVCSLTKGSTVRIEQRKN